MKKVCIIIRVYDRIEDLEHCINIIRDTWKLFDYYILVVANGRGMGFNIDLGSQKKIDKLIDLENNAGHLKGNAQLLQEGILHIPGDCGHAIILEADTWIYGDELIAKYITKLATEEAVWASAQWYSHLYSLATDFAIIDTAFLRSNPQVFTYSGFAETYSANYILNHNLGFVYITENMPVHLPSYIKHYPFAMGIRFTVFPKSKMVTHHVELLKGGMERKKLLFNTLANTSYFKGDNLKPNKFLKTKILLAVKLSYLLPMKGWMIKNKMLVIE